jgi:hypothetical protein
MRAAKFAVAVLVVSLFVLSSLPSAAPVHAVSGTCEGDAIASVSFDTPAINEYRLSGTGPGLPTEPQLSSDTLPESFEWFLPGPGSWDVTLEWRRDGLDWNVSERDELVVITCLPVPLPEPTLNPAGPPAANLFDGRINNDQSRDVAAPVAVYCAAGNIDVYQIDVDTGSGTLVLRVPQVEGTPAGTQLLQMVQGVSLYWLETGDYQLMTANFEGLPYVITWAGCDSGTLAHLGA